MSENWDYSAEHFGVPHIMLTDHERENVVAAYYAGLAAQITDEMAERAARALFAHEEARDKHVECGMVAAREWDSLPAGCPVHASALERARVVLAAADARPTPRDQPEPRAIETTSEKASEKHGLFGEMTPREHLDDIKRLFAGGWLSVEEARDLDAFWRQRLIDERRGDNAKEPAEAGSDGRPS